MNSKKIGIFGGTFNPVHKGHELAAVSFYNKLGLDKLIIMPSNIPPHKQADANVTAVQRLEMCRIAFGGLETETKIEVEVSDFEVKKEGKSYTFDTVSDLRKTYKNDKLYFLIGSDMFLYFENWYKHLELLKLCALAVAYRNINDNENEAGKREILNMRDRLVQTGAEIELLENEPFEISSTEIRAEIRKNIYCNDNAGYIKYIKTEVLDYIKKQGIYL